MARVKLSSILISLQGKYGGGVFRSFRGTTTLASLQHSRKEHYTAAQVNYRETVGSCSKAWSGLSISEKDAWGTVAAYLTEQWGHYKNEAGTHNFVRTPRGPYSGIDALISCHANLRSVRLWRPGWALKPAPIGVTAPSSTLITTFGGSLANMTVWWKAVEDWGLNGTPAKYRVFMKSENDMYYPQLTGYRTHPGLGRTITFLRTRGSAQFHNLTHGTYYVQIDALNAEGLRSAPSDVRSKLI